MTADIEHFAQIIKGTKFCMFTTKDERNEEMHSRPMTLQDAEFDGTLWFLADKTTEFARQIEAHPVINLAFSNIDKMNFLSATGEATLLNDPAIEKELWSPAYKLWFEKGLDDPKLTLIKVVIRSAEYWESPQSRVVRLAAFAAGTLGISKANEALGQRGHLDMN